MSAEYITHGSPANPALVMLHGVGGNGHSFEALLNLAASRYHAIAWHMPGYNGDPMPTERAYDWPFLVDALTSLLDELNLERVTLLGHSIGGMLAQLFVNAHPSRVEKLVLSATSPAFGQQDGDFQAAFLAKRLAPLDNGQSMSQMAETLVDSLLAPGASPNARAAAISCMGQVPATAYRAAMQCIVTFEARALLPDIACPTLLLAGEHDRNAPPPVLQRMASKIPHSQYHCLDAVGHLAYMERPSAYWHALTQFLDPMPSGETHD